MKKEVHIPNLKYWEEHEVGGQKCHQVIPDLQQLYGVFRARDIRGGLLFPASMS